MAATDGFGCRFEPVEDIGEGAHEPGEPGGAVEPGELVDVGAGAERAPLAGDDERPHRVVGVELGERGVEGGQRVGADGVEPVGAGERDDGDAVAGPLDAERVAHGSTIGRSLLAGVPAADAHDIVSPPLTDSV